MAYQTPKTDWVAPDSVLPADMNRIEGNTEQNHADIGTLDSDLDNHTGDSTIHKTSGTIRGESATLLVIECRTSDPASPANGQMWLRTDL